MSFATIHFRFRTFPVVSTWVGKYIASYGLILLIRRDPKPVPDASFWQVTMYIYLPIAEVSMHIGIIIGLGGGVGFLSGLFGVGGGF